jgi:glycosyltransferase involved in cell wall biosynthesis
MSVILPAYNERKNIRHAILTLRELAESSGVPEYELIVVDDGSDDGTREEALKVADAAHIRVVGYPHNRGKGFAVKYGIERSVGDVVFFLDSDLEINPSGLSAYLASLRDCDVVIGSKRHPKSRVQAPAMRRILSFAFHTLVKLLVGLKVSDTQPGLKAGRGECFRRVFGLLSVKKFAFDVEMLVVAHLLKLRIREAPVEINLEGQFKTREVVRMFLDILGITYRLRVKRWYQSNLNNDRPRYVPIVRW